MQFVVFLRIHVYRDYFIYATRNSLKTPYILNANYCRYLSIHIYIVLFYVSGHSLMYLAVTIKN